MGNSWQPYKEKTYLAIAMEPVFVGTGGYRIGRVDNTIIREPGTNIPKVPGTTIEGNTRYYSWLACKTNGMSLSLGCAKGKKTKDKDNNEIFACGECPVCLTYGYVQDKNNKTRAGLAYFSDARILFFPVATMIGPVWVSCKRALEEVVEFSDADKNLIENITNGNFVATQALEPFLPEANSQKCLNFGWLMLKKREESLNPSTWRLKGDAVDLQILIKQINAKICVVSDEIFSQMVNSNLETRTSVSINPITGAAESGALFTYEAIPRGTIFWFDVTYENPQNYELSESLELVIGTVEKGLEPFSALGIGGMGTRGFGKIDVIKDNYLKEEEYWESTKELITELIEKKQEIERQIKEAKERNNAQKEAKKRELEEEMKLWYAYIQKHKEKLSEEKKNIDELIKKLTEIENLCKEQEGAKSNN